MQSNPTTTMDSVTGYEMYIAKAQELGMKSFGFSEHGNILEWLHKKEMIESSGMKYIHAIEMYVTKDLKNKVRDNYHVVMIAKNYDGVMELNKMSSKAFNRADVKNVDNKERFYFNPRISYSELKNTSDNIIITTACLGGILNVDDNNIELNELKWDFVDFLSENNHRCFLEVQHHNVLEQKEYNKTLLAISEKFDIPLIAGTDTHSLNQDYEDGRKVLQRAKKIHFQNEENWDLTFKTYEELVEAYDKQGALPKEVYLEAIENTNVMSDMVEEFSVDRSHKYPKIYENSDDIFKQKIKDGIKTRGVNVDNEVKERISREYKAMKENGSIDYLLLEENIKSWCRDNGILYGYSRGSVSGSFIAYLLNVTDMDSIKENLIFERFMNPHRQSLCDIDTDYPPSQRESVKDYIYTINGVYCADVITFNTIAKKGAIRDVGRAFEIPLSEVDSISNRLEFEEGNLRDEYPELFKYVDLLNGVVVSIGSHPGGIVVSPVPLDSVMGLCTLGSNHNPVTQLNMKEIDSLNFVKLDVLGLDNIEIINETCKLAGIERLTPDNMDVTDEKVWESIKDSSLLIFQWESNTAQSYYRRLFSKETLDKIKQDNPDFSYIDLFSIGNGAIRPAGESYRDELSRGEFRENGHPALNEFLKDTRGFLVFQEQIIRFLNEFCGFSMAKADTVRRGFAKKTGTEQHIPKIREGFTKTMQEKYNVGKYESEDLIENFISVIQDSSDYLFSVNHSQAYSYIGYACAWLRYYYPLEYLTVALNVIKSEEIADVISYIKEFTDIQIKPIKFKESGAGYRYNKEENAIYQGIESLKYLNKQVGDDLYALRNRNFDDFYDVMVALTDKSIDTNQLKILISLDFFVEYGNNKKLIEFSKKFQYLYGRKQINKLDAVSSPIDVGLIERYSRSTDKLYKDMDIEMILKEELKNIPNNRMTLKEQIEIELKYLGYIQYSNSSIDENYYVVTEFRAYENNKAKPYFTLYKIKDGTTIKCRIKNGNLYRSKSFKEKSVIDVKRIVQENKNMKVNGRWIMSDEKEPVLKNWDVLIQ